jgi:hypothetical protein
MPNQTPDVNKPGDSVVDHKGNSDNSGIRTTAKKPKRTAAIRGNQMIKGIIAITEIIVITVIMEIQPETAAINLKNDPYIDSKNNTLISHFIVN